MPARPLLLLGLRNEKQIHPSSHLQTPTTAFHWCRSSGGSSCGRRPGKGGRSVFPASDEDECQNKRRRVHFRTILIFQWGRKTTAPLRLPTVNHKRTPENETNRRIHPPNIKRPSFSAIIDGSGKWSILQQSRSRISDNSTTQKRRDPDASHQIGPQ